jgi:hypothetical protein
MNRFPAQFDIAEGKAFAYDPVLEYSPIFVPFGNMILSSLT